MTQQEAADKLGVIRAAYANYEVGTTERFNLELIKRMGAPYHVPVRR